MLIKHIMPQDRYFKYKKSQIENFVKAEFKKKFRFPAKISIRKRQKFIAEMTNKVSKRFGKDILFLINFSKQGFCAVVSPVLTESTDKGNLKQSFSLPQVYYTTHCVDRFSERANTKENCIFHLDALLGEAILTFGENEGYLSCSEGVFAYEFENERLIVKTFINSLQDNEIIADIGCGSGRNLSVIGSKYEYPSINKKVYTVGSGQSFSSFFEGGHA